MGRLLSIATILMLVLSSGRGFQVIHIKESQTCVLMCSDTDQFAVAPQETPQLSRTSQAMASPFADRFPRNCQEWKRLGITFSGLYSIQPYDCCPERHVQVFCDMATDGGGWTVIQRRDKYDRQEDFDRTWDSYKEGFGNLDQEFWLGLEHIHALTNQSDYEVRFDLEDFEGDSRFAKYSTFNVDSESNLFRLTIADYTGNAGDEMSFHDQMNFSTKDRDNDKSDGKCAIRWSGGWWFKACYNAHLNGKYFDGPPSVRWTGIIWEDWKGSNYSLKKTEIKIRPKE